jgi:hypothetical protein
MTRWVDQPDWGDDTAKALPRLLSNAIYLDAEMRQVWMLAGMEPGMFRTEPTPRTGWTAMLRDAQEAGRLEALLRQAEEMRPALNPDVAPAFAEVAALH